MTIVLTSKGETWFNKYGSHITFRPDGRFDKVSNKEVFIGKFVHLISKGPEMARFIHKPMELRNFLLLLTRKTD